MQKEFLVREMLPEDAEGKGRVHYLSWQESYHGIVDSAYLNAMSQEKCVAMARKWPENTAVAICDGQVAGFVCWCPSRDTDIPEGTGELNAIYILDAYKGCGLGRQLMDYGMEKLSHCPQVVLWVLAENQRAIGFYQHYGFTLDGEEQFLKLGTPVRCVRMAKKI